MTKLVNFSFTSWIIVTLSHNRPCVVVSSLAIQRTNEKYVSLSISKIAQGTSVQRRDRGPSHKHLMVSFFSEFNHITFLPHMNCASLVDSKEITQFQLSGCLPWRAQHRMHQAVTNDFYTSNVSLISTRLAVPYWTIYSPPTTICSRRSNRPGKYSGSTYQCQKSLMRTFKRKSLYFTW